MARLNYGKTSAPTSETPGDYDFKDIWNYLKWLRKGYDTAAGFTDLPSTRELASKGMDYLSGSGSGAGSGGVGGASAADMSAASAYDSAFSGGAASGAGEGAAGMSTAGYASLLAPLAATYMAYTKGSGRNEPLEKRMETQGAVPLLKNILEGQQVKSADLWSKYRQQPRYTQGEGGSASDVIDENYKPSVSELWNQMHYTGQGHKQNTGSSGFSDADIDANILKSGVDKDALLKALGLTELPDWTKQTYDSWFANNSKVNNNDIQSWL
jgi:hypothetical protein